MTMKFLFAKGFPITGMTLYLFRRLIRSRSLYSRPWRYLLVIFLIVIAGIVKFN